MAHPVVENLAARAKLQVCGTLEEIAVFPVCRECSRARTLARIIDRAIESPIPAVANQRRFSNDNESARSASDFREETAAEGVVWKGRRHAIDPGILTFA